MVGDAAAALWWVVGSVARTDGCCVLSTACTHAAFLRAGLCASREFLPCMVQLLVCGHAPTQLAAALELALGRCGSVNCQPAQPGLAGLSPTWCMMCCVCLHASYAPRACFDSLASVCGYVMSTASGDCCQSICPSAAAVSSFLGATRQCCVQLTRYLQLHGAHSTASQRHT